MFTSTCVKVCSITRISLAGRAHSGLAAAAGALFKEAGLVPAEKLLASSSKVLSFRKPLEPGTGERAGPPAAVPAMAA